MKKTLDAPYIRKGLAFRVLGARAGPGVKHQPYH